MRNNVFKIYETILHDISKYIPGTYETTLYN